MAHTDRQPSQEIFDDIVSATKATWRLLYFNRRLEDSYYLEKIDHLESVTNFADNWYSPISRLDAVNQRIMFSFLKRRDTKEFIIKQRLHYSYQIPVCEI